MLIPPTPFPDESPGTGRARWVAAVGSGMVERFASRCATDSLSFDDGGGYAPVALAEVDARGAPSRGHWVSV